MISSTQMRPGMVVKFNNDLFSVFSVNHRTPGNLRGFGQPKMRNLRSGTMIEHRFSSEDKVERAALEEHEMEYLYDDGEYFYFMNTENYEQMHLTKDLLGDAPHQGDHGGARRLRHVLQHFRVQQYRQQYGAAAAIRPVVQCGDYRAAAECAHEPVLLVYLGTESAHQHLRRRPQ